MPEPKDFKGLAKSAVDSVGLLDLAQATRKRLSRVQRRTDKYLRRVGVLRPAPLVPPQAYQAACKAALDLLRSRGHAPADYLEFGVCQGTSMACMFHAAQHANLPDLRLIGFDSFEGLPSEAANEHWEPGAFACPQEVAETNLCRAGVAMDRVHLVPGWFNATLTEDTRRRLNLTRVSIAMVDCDIYSSSSDALAFLGPLIDDMAVVFFDDWGWRADADEIGQREAFAEFLVAHPEFRATECDSYFHKSRVFLVERI